jgi:hypothetical protein
VRDNAWKLNQAGELFSMKDAPFVEAPATDSPEAQAAKKRLQAVLDELNPAAGKTVPPGGGGKKKADRKGKKKAKAAT